MTLAVDTSALIAILAREPEGVACQEKLYTPHLVISAATVTEALIVATRRGFGPQMHALLDHWGFVTENVTPDFARRAAAAYERFGKGAHSASLNYGDCFSYAVAEMHDCPLLYIGNDFAQTDIRSALAQDA